MILLFDFDIVHTRENNPESQGILKANRERLNKGCKKVHELLLSGIRLNPDNFKRLTGQSEYRRRYADLAAAGYPVKWKSIGGGAKEWYYDQEYINQNKYEAI